MHSRYLALVVPLKGGSPTFDGPYLTHAEARTAVQEQLGEDSDVMGGVVPFDLVEAAPKPAPVAAPAPAPAPSPAAAQPSAEAQASGELQNDGSGSSA